MAVKNRVLVMVIACALLLAMSIGPGVANPARALPESSAGPVGTTIPYAGRLSDDAGQPVADGAYDLSFALYSTATGGDPIWSETQRGVVVSKGQFLATLGSVVPIPATALGGRTGWLAVGVRGPGEAGFTALSPRQLVSVAAPAAPTAGMACPHDHLGEWWTGDPGTGNNGLRVESSRTDSNGITGVAHNGSNAVGVFGWTTQGVGVQGSSDSNTGVKGTSVGGWGLEAVGKEEGPFTSRKGDLVLDGTYGDAFAPGLLRLWSDRHVFILLDANNDGADVFQIFNGAGWGVFQVNESGDTVAMGSKSALVETPNHGPRLVYTVESPQVWIEDFGTASLVNGRAIVPIEPVFAETVNLESDYHVFLTPLGDCQGLYVAAKSPTSFEARELGGGTASIGFDYRIIAKRRGYENTRLESPELPASPDGK
jgi:hypothetical protein